MKRKDYEPIKFEFFQTDMEKMMFFITDAQILIGQTERKDLASQLSSIIQDLQHKVNIHKERGEWI